jgi:hypothetical protein
MDGPLTSRIIRHDLNSGFAGWPLTVKDKEGGTGRKNYPSTAAGATASYRSPGKSLSSL